MIKHLTLLTLLFPFLLSATSNNIVNSDETKSPLPRQLTANFYREGINYVEKIQHYIADLNLVQVFEKIHLVHPPTFRPNLFSDLSELRSLKALCLTENAKVLDIF